MFAVNRRAASFDLAPGLAVTRALARCPHLLLLPRDPEAETSALADLLAFVESLGPDFELTTPDTLILDLGGTRRNPPFRIPRSALAALGLPARLALGPSPDLAHLAALVPATSHNLVFRGPDHRWRRGSHAAASVETPHLDSLPTTLLDHLPDPPSLALFQQWGLHTLADLARLPRQGLAERLGPAAARLHDLLHQKNHRLLHLFRPIESFDSITPLEHSVENCESLIFIIKRSLQTLSSRLASSYRATAEIDLLLDLERHPPHHHRIRLPEPAHAPDTLLRPLATHLEHLQLPGPVTGFRLTLTSCAPQAGQHQLFERGIRHPHRLADTFVRLSALLGEENIGFPVPASTHRPDTFHLRPPHQLFQKDSDTSPPPASPPPIKFLPPLHRFRPPLEIAVAFERKDQRPHPLALLTGPHRGRITGLRGPFPLSGAWWDSTSAWQHLEWDIYLESRHLLRLSHTPPDLWQLQGTYP